MKSQRQASINYDATMKILVGSKSPIFFELLNVAPYKKEIHAEFSSPINRRIDYLSYHQGKTSRDNSVVHIEFQSSKEADMNWRMLEYYCLIAEKTGLREKYDKNLHQYVIYVGADNVSMPDSIENDNIRYNFKYFDARKIDPTSRLLRSGAIYDKILGVLCQSSLNDAQWKVVLEALVSESHRSMTDARDACALLLAILSVRPISDKARYKLRSILMEIDVERSPLLQEIAVKWTESGRDRHARDILSKEFRRRGLVPSAAAEAMFDNLSADEADAHYELLRDGTEPGLVMDTIIATYGLKP